MYLGHYGLEREPFHITPDPDFLYLSPSHREAFATVVYGVEKRKGFVALTGEVGVGKTTVLRAYLKRVENSPVRPIYIFNPDVTFDQLLVMILRSLDEEPGDAPASAMIDRIHWLLIEAYKRNENVALIIDEAQNMPVETLEKLRMLSNLETTTDKLIQIVLVGQPELEQKLELHQLRQLRQRLAVRARVKALSPKETHEYIQHRLTQAGAVRDDIFTPAAIRAIIRHAKGNPRVTNILADNSLIAGFGADAPSVTDKIVREVIADLDGRKPRALRWTLAAAGLTVLLAPALALGGWMTLTPKQPAGDRNVVHADAPAVVAVVPAAIDGPVNPAPAQQPLTLGNDHRTVMLDMMTRVLEPQKPQSQAPAEAAPEQAPETAAKPAAAPDIPAPAPVPAAPDTAVPEAVLAVTPEPPKEPHADAMAAETVAVAVAAPAPVPDGPATPSLAKLEAGLETAAETVLNKQPGTVTRLVAKGDTLSRLVREFYGYSRPELIESVRRLNPQITNPDYILAGDTLVFPVGMESESGGLVSAAATPGAQPQDRKRP